MTVTQLLTADLELGVPALLGGASVVALVPATELRGWAADMAWAIARAAAAGGRRTVLVDCFVGAPTLHGAEGNDEGLVDVFEYGASLNRIVREQPQADLFFIPAGTYSADAEPLMQHPRWKRLSAGFRHEEALLLLYVAAEHLAGLAAEPDGIIVLAPQGLELAAVDAPALALAVGRGMPLLAVVADEESVARVSGVHAALPEPQPDRRPEPPQPVFRERTSAPMAMLVESSRPRRGWMVWTLIILAAGAAALRFGVLGPTGSRAAPAVSPVPGAVPAPAARAGAESVQAAPPPAPTAAESLPFAVQVAALPRLADAFVLSDTLAAHGTPAMIAPVRLRGRPPLYRVHAGPFATRARADAALAALRAARLLSADAGSVASVPLSVALGEGRTRDAAMAERARLRAAGVPSFILGQADGSFRLYAGAYDAGAQVALLEDLLTPTGNAGNLVPRTGYVP